MRAFRVPERLVHAVERSPVKTAQDRPRRGAISTQPTRSGPDYYSSVRLRFPTIVSPPDRTASPLGCPIRACSNTDSASA